MPQFVAPFIGRGVVLKTPTADGSSGQVIQTDGAGTLSFASAAGGIPDLDIRTISTSDTVVVGDKGKLLDVTDAATLTLDDSATLGDKF
jgi:hypothetical protein